MPPKGKEKAALQAQKQIADDITKICGRLFQLASADVPPMKQWDQFLSLYAGIEKLEKLQAQLLALTPESKAWGDPSSGKPEQKDLDAFATWLKDGGCEGGLDAIEFKAGLEHGNGVIAKKDIESDSTILSIPSKLMITSVIEGIPSMESIMLRVPILARIPNFLLPLRLIVESFDKDSSFTPYIKALPRYIPVQLFWTVEEFDLLKGSSTLGRALKDYRVFIRAYVTIYNGLDNPLPQPNAPPLSILPAQFTWRVWRWAMGIICSRQNNFVIKPAESESERPLMGMALMPGLDMFNHEPGDVIANEFDFGAQVSNVKAIRSFKEGEEVKIVYGHRSNDQLLMYSGFVDASKGAEDIGIPIAPPGDKSKLTTERLRLLTDCQFPATNGVMLQLFHPPYPDRSAILFAYVRIILADEEQLIKIRELMKDDEAAVAKAGVLGEDFERQVCKWIAIRAQIVLRGYPTTAAADKELLATLPKISVKYNNISLRMMEKQLLEEAIAGLNDPKEEWLREPEPIAGVDGTEAKEPGAAE